MQTSSVSKNVMLFMLLGQVGWFTNCSESYAESDTIADGMFKYAHIQGRKLCKEPSELDDIDYDVLKSKNNNKKKYAKQEERDNCIKAKPKISHEAARQKKYVVGNKELAEVSWMNFNLRNECQVCNTKH